MSNYKYRIFMLFKLPAAWLMGVKVSMINNSSCICTLKYRWINQNPFKSIFWAAQGMAAEFATGVLLMREIELSNKNISMLLVDLEGNFTKKAIGKISFKCDKGLMIKEEVSSLNSQKTKSTIWIDSIGIDETGQEVSKFKFNWSILLKK
ncbi:MAG: DUF4442 domain-containing protein [Flavobacteriales bacterium TMED96]|nr:MAG: DUF4442 domain-containing protein [Flavobacteriales bacterium TMED96]